MQLLATAEQMQEYDRAAINALGIPGLLLMENAGRAFVDVLERRCGGLDSKYVAVLCGKGNNGGDGFVIARHLLNRGCRVEVFLLGKGREVRGDALQNLEVVRKLARRRGSQLSYREVRSVRSRRAPEIIVDALFGTGFKGAVRGPTAGAIEWVNSAGGFVASVDIPSGVDATTGVVENLAVRASLTVTMGLAKIGHVVGAGRDHSGEVVVVDIGIPQLLFTSPRRPVFRPETRDIKTGLPARARTAHKYAVGKVLVVAGSRNFTGAPALSASAALRGGAGAVVLAAPASIHDSLSRKLTEVIVTPVQETPDGTIARAALDSIMERVGWADVVALGPGLARHAETDSVIATIVKEAEKPLVIDADGLNALEAKSNALCRRGAETVLTPHAGELSRLTGEQVASIEKHRVEAARKAADTLRSVVVLKGNPTVTAEPGGAVYVNATGNPGMATIGSGDVLTGLVASLWAQGMGSAAAAYAGAFLHGLAGDMAAQRFGERSLLAGDILALLPDALKAAEQ